MCGYSTDGCQKSIACSGSIDPLKWEGSSIDELLHIDPDTPENGLQALNINEEGWMVGVGSPDGFTCQYMAAGWASETSSPVAFGTFGNIGAADETIAYAINDATLLQVVGTNASTEQALLWEEVSPGTWGSNAIILDDVIPSCSQDEWALSQAFDINDNGWILGWGLKKVAANTFEKHAFILIPSCAADFMRSDGNCPDGFVNVFDLLELLQNWHEDNEPPDNPPGSRPGDITDSNNGPPDGFVNVFDLLMVLQQWGPCGIGGGPMPENESDCFDKFYPDEMEALISCFEAVAELQE